NICNINFNYTCSVILKFYANVISADHCPGPTNVFLPRFPVKPMIGVVRTGRPDWCRVAQEASITVPPPLHQPLAHVERDCPLKPLALLSGRSLRPLSRL